MRYFIAIFSIFCLFVGVSAVQAEMSSSNYKIRWDSMTNGGGDDRTSTNYQLRDSAGNQGAGENTSTNYGTGSGYRAGVFDQVITYEVAAQNNGSSVSASNLSGTTVTVSDTTGFSTGDLVAIVQDEGGSQVSGVGKVISKTASDLTLDQIQTDGTLSLDGSNDLVYALDNLSSSLGTLNDSSVTTSLIGFNVSADVDNGYSVQMMEDGDLRDGANDIDDVADGSVTAGSEEYGASASDGTLSSSTFDTQDTAITQSFQEVATEGDNSFESRHFVTLKAAIDSSTPDGNYGQTLTVIVSGNY
jgi:hypothetical protein